MTTSARAKVLLGSAAALAVGGLVLVLGPMSGATSSGRPADAPPTTAPTTTEAPTTTAPTTTTTIDDGSLRIGKSGPLVLALQAKLTSLGYWLGPANGAYGLLTEQAVMAFQKVNGLDRDGIAGVTTLAAVATATRPVPPSTVDGFEVDLARQVIWVVQGGQLLWTFNTSTGKPSTPTNPGDFKVFRQVNGVDPGPVGPLYRPKYFDAGDAIHGSPSIPGYAASHGCSRVSNPAMDFLWASGLLEVGTPVRVH